MCLRHMVKCLDCMDWSSPGGLAYFRGIASFAVPGEENRCIRNDLGIRWTNDAHSELRRRRKQRAERQRSTAIAVGISAVAPIRLLTKRP